LTGNPRLATARLDFAALPGEARVMTMQRYLAPLALLVLAACGSQPHYSYGPPPPPPAATGSLQPYQGQPAQPARPRPAVPSYGGASAGPLSPKNVGAYMDGVERDLRHYLRGIPVGRPGDVVVLNLKSDDLFDKAALNDDGRDLLRNLASALRHYDRTQVQVSGYTDTRAAPDQALKTTQKRADAVAAELRADGIDGKRIVAVGQGSAHLKFATGDGVADARNRRIEIRIVPKPG
jgi:outer membrane protein OmpA-like peptidoglycan-associated protein